MIHRVLMVMLWMCCLSFAQEEKNELGLLLGADFIPKTTTPNETVNLGRSIAYSVDYARRLSTGNTALFLEFPFAAAPSHKVESTQLNTISSLATLFVTPSLRARFGGPRSRVAVAIRRLRIWTLRRKSRIAKRSC